METKFGRLVQRRWRGSKFSYCVYDAVSGAYFMKTSRLMNLYVPLVIMVRFALSFDELKCILFKPMRFSASFLHKGKDIDEYFIAMAGPAECQNFDFGL